MSRQHDVLQNSNIFSKKQLTNRHLRSVTIFILGLLLGWLVLGWGLFPAKTSPVTPTELQPDVVNDYLLMTAESYNATHDLRAAGRRLHYWDNPDVLGPKMNKLSHELESTNPAGAAYLQVLALDLDLPAVAAPQQASSQKGGFNLMWLLIPVLALGVLVVLILIAQRFNLLSSETPYLTPEQPETDTAPSLIDDRPEESPVFQPVTSLPADEELADDLPLDDERSDDLPDDGEEAMAPALDTPDAAPEFSSDDETVLQLEEKEEEESFDFADVPEFLSDEAQATPPEPDAEDILPPDAFESPETTPVPLPPHYDTENPAPQLLRFDGNPTYNTIIAIEPNDDYLGEFGLSANQTAPNNANLTLTLEVWLFDKTDTQTTELALVPPVIASDPELKARYIKDDAPVLALKSGQTFVLETAELKVEGRVRQVVLGAATRDGVPIIERAEIELSGRKKA